MIAATAFAFALGYFVRTGLCWMWHGAQWDEHCRRARDAAKTQGPVLDKDQLVI